MGLFMLASTVTCFLFSHTHGALQAYELFENYINFNFLQNILYCN
jgi:hypothetical protein